MRTVADVPEAFVPVHFKQLQFIAAGFNLEIVSEQVLHIGAGARPVWLWCLRPIRKAGDHMIMKIFEAPTLNCIGAFLHGLDQHKEELRKQLHAAMDIESDDGEMSITELIAVLISQRDNARTSEKMYQERFETTEQKTKCALCLEFKHTPLRVDRLGGYVCLTCIDKEFDKALKPDPSSICTFCEEKPRAPGGMFCRECETREQSRMR